VIGGVERTEHVLDDVRREVSKSIAKHGAQLDLPMGTGAMTAPLWTELAMGIDQRDGAPMVAEQFKADTDLHSKQHGDGSISWWHILREEVFEAAAEDDLALLRAELIQVAAVAVKMCEVIDRKSQDSGKESP
jgi:hypothetical protein